jgi:hypothetical protein
LSGARCDCRGSWASRPRATAQRDHCGAAFISTLSETSPDRRA